MSAWIVSKAHIDVLVWALGKRELLEHSPDEAGRILWEENHRSVNYRYNEQEPTPAYSYTPPPVRWTDEQLPKIVGCYDYQTCETDDYRQTVAGRYVTALEASLVMQGISLEADGGAPWGICDCGGSHEAWRHDELAGAES